MSYSKQELQTKFTAFIEEASEEELEVLSHMINGWQGKRNNQYHSFIGSFLQTRRRWREDNVYEVVIPVHPGLENPLQMVHGGITATLLDTSMGGAANEMVPEGCISVTMEMKINYVKPGKGSFLRAEVKMVSKGNSTIVMEGRVYDDQSELIAYGSGTFFIISRSN
ncbi:PaaI family thioesterase [Salibacterium aidingense]|uniref:PaaI family thioesterase n=1 Tax=Salibacterium aidingense TaxID=384933 RepID=UPI000418E957|nr:PaaI family thioesterase [Salibacterium aidingense]